VTKIQAGRLTYQDELFYIDELVKEIVADQNLISDTHKIILKGASKKVFLGDKYRIGQVLINLINNAIKYSPKADKVMVSLKDTTQGTVFRVRDYGIGIRKFDQARVFERFYRGSNEKSKIQGLGMGLYISSEIIKRYGGRLWLKSSPSRGSSFFVLLPKKKF